jgi:hypothetical protein
VEQKSTQEESPKPLVEAGPLVKAVVADFLVDSFLDHLVEEVDLLISKQELENSVFPAVQL